MESQINRKKVLFSIFLIITLGIIVYANSLNGEFIGDDYNLVKNNPEVRSFSNALRVFEKRPNPDITIQVFSRPVPIFTYAFDYSIWKLDVRGYHITSVVFHILAALTVYWLINILFKNNILSLITSLFFVVHPVHAEAVSYISGRNDCLVLIFMMLSFIFYIKYVEYKKVGFFILLVLSYALSIMSKENSLILPGLLIAYHIAFKKKPEYIALASIFVMAFGSYISKILVVTPGTVSVSAPGASALDSIPGFFVALSNYFRMLFLPFNLHFDYGNPLFSLSEPKAIVGMIISVFLAFYALLIIRKNTLVFFGIAWFFITLFPVSNIPIGLFSYMADHFLYVPSVGFFLIVASVFCNGYKIEKLKIPTTVFLAGILIFYSFLTVKQNEYWRYSKEFYERTLKYNPESTFSIIALGAIEYRKGNLEKAKKMFEQILENEPHHKDAYYNLGKVYDDRGDKEKALEFYKKSQERDWAYTDTYINMAKIYSDMGNKEEAIKMFERLIKQHPKRVVGYFKLGILFSDMDRKEDAIRLYKEALSIDPNNKDVLNNLASVYYGMGSKDEAIKIYNKIIKIDPYYVSAYNNLGIIYYDIGREDEAVKLYEKAKKIDPDFFDAYDSLGAIYAERGELDKAMLNLNKALEINPTSANTYYNRFLLYEDMGETDKAKSDYEKAVELDPSLAGE